jgi:hypothetical protein
MAGTMTLILTGLLRAARTQRSLVLENLAPSRAVFEVRIFSARCLGV